VETAAFSWSFPGGLWGLGSVALLILCAAIASYSFPIRSVKPWAKALLIALRLGFLAVALWCLCGPETVKERKGAPGPKPKIAIVLDESSSMTLKGAKGKSRLDEAVAEAKETVRAYGEAFDFKFFAFSEGVRELSKIDDAGNYDQRQLKSTELYKDIAELSRRLAGSYRAAICLTDGVDSSSGGRIEQALDALESGAPPHIFKAMTLPLKSKESVEIERIEAPAGVKAGSVAPVTMVVRCSGIEPSEPLEAQVLKNGRQIWREPIEVSSRGTFTKAISFNVPVKTPGAHSFEAVVSAGGRQEASVRWSVRGVEGGRLKVLIYMGGLDWGARFMRKAFEGSDLIGLEVKYAPDFLGSNTGVASKVTDSFVKPEDLEKYDALILMDLRRHQIKPEMERQLGEYLEKGGSLLFLVANTETGQEFANSPVEKFLPVSFERNISQSSDLDEGTKQFVERMKRFRQGLMMERSARAKQGDLELPPLERFKVTDAGLRSGIFDYALEGGALKEQSVPAFEEFALVREAKPGADELAVHPGFKDAAGNPRALLATQRFGRGRSALMACDPLWRWKMSMDSKSVFYEGFWSHLITWLCAGRESQPQWKSKSLVLEAGKPAEIRFSLPPRSVPYKELEFSSECAGESRRLEMKPTERADEYKCEVTPAPGRSVALLAKRAGATVAEISVSGGPPPQARELETLRPDIACLKRMAAASGGELVERLSDAGIAKLEPPKDAAPTIKEETPLWHRASVFAALLALVCAELLVRRSFRLV